MTRGGVGGHAGYRKGDLPEISVVGCDVSERRRDPFGALPSTQKYNISESYRFRDVKPSRRRPAYEQK